MALAMSLAPWLEANPAAVITCLEGHYTGPQAQGGNQPRIEGTAPADRVIGQKPNTTAITRRIKRYSACTDGQRGKIFPLVTIL